VRLLREWFGGIRRAFRRRLGETIYVKVADPPDVAWPGILYIVGDETPWCGVLACPCRCGASIHLSFVHGDRPSWGVVVGEDDRPTLSPSVDRVVGCRSHFFLRRGCIVWAGAERPDYSEARSA
jgi:hypothetical protein